MSIARVVVGISGGVAAYKGAALVSRLVQADIDVTAVLTEAAREFVGDATFAALTGKPVPRGSFDLHDYPLGPHIELARNADLLCVAPATANFLSKAACGAADDLLSTLLLSVTGPVLLAPAMNCEMWEKPAVQRNIDVLTKDGYHFVGPEEGWLSCRVKGKGRMADPETIFARIQELLAK